MSKLYENFDNTCKKIEEATKKVLTSDIKIDIAKKITQFNGNQESVVDYFINELSTKTIRGIIDTKTNIVSLKDYTEIYLESLVFELKINNITHLIQNIQPGYYNIKTMSKELDFLKIPFRVVDSEKKIVIMDTENVELSNFFQEFRFINRFHYITIIIPQLNWKKEIPIKNNSFFQFKIDETIKIPKSSILETKLNILFTVGETQLKATEIFFNLVYELN